MNSQNRQIILITSLLLGILLFSVAPTFSQDLFPRTEDLLRWYPLGDYDLIIHKDYESLQEAHTWKIYDKLFDPFDSWIKIDFQLPRPLQYDILSSTMAQVLRIRTAIFEDKARADNYKQVYGDMLTSDIFNDKIYKFESVGERLFIFRYIYLEDKIKQSVRTGQLEKLELKIYNRPVYTYTGRFGSETKTFFVYATESQELLLSFTLPTLERMVHSGRGYFLSLIDGREYMDLPHLSDLLGNSWQFTSFAAHYRALLYRMRTSGVDPIKLDLIRRKLLETESYRIKSMALGEEMMFRSVHHFPTLSRASDWFEKNRLVQNVDFMSVSFVNRNNMLFYRPRKYELQGNLVVSAVVYQGAVIDELIVTADEAEDRREQHQNLLDEFREKKLESGPPKP